MKNIWKLFLCLCLVFIGIMIGKPSADNVSNLDKDIKDFEDEITRPNDYDSKEGNSKGNIDPNIANSIGKKGEKIITGISDYVLNFVIGIFEK